MKCLRLSERVDKKEGTEGEIGVDIGVGSKSKKKKRKKERVDRPSSQFFALVTMNLVERLISQLLFLGEGRR